MRDLLKVVLYYYVIALSLAGIIYLLQYGVRNATRTANRLKHESREAYIEGNYPVAFAHLTSLIDSLNLHEDAIALDRAHAGYLLSSFDSSQWLRNYLNHQSPDSLAAQENPEAFAYAQCVAYYKTLGETSSDDRLASIAYNQLGMIMYALREEDKPEEVEKAMLSALDQFKTALRKDHRNTFARFNYELIQRKIDYPKKIMKFAQTLIKQRKYSEARDFLKESMKKDEALKRNFSAFIPRIENIIKIDSLNTL